MKYISICIFVLSSFSVFAQRADRFLDSLNNKSQRTWYQEDGARFTQLNDNCSYGMEMTFYRVPNQMTWYKCEAGAWKKFDYTYEVTTEDENHYIKILDKNKKVITKMEIQMLGSANNHTTEITYYEIASKKFYTLISP
jgi:hypothetical protein